MLIEFVGKKINQTHLALIVSVSKCTPRYSASYLTHRIKEYMILDLDGLERDLLKPTQEEA